MADINITNLQAGQAAIDELVKGITELNTVCSTVSGKPFGALESVNPDLGTNFNTELNNSLVEIYSFLNDKVAPALSEYFKPDDGVPGEDVVVGGGGYGGNGGNGGNGDSGESGGSGGSDDSNSNQQVSVNLVSPVDAGPINEMKLDEIDGTVEALIALSGDQALDSFVESDVNADKIKQLLLDSPNIPQEFKDQIKDADSKAVRRFIEDMLKGKYPEAFGLNAVNLSIMYRYLEQIASDNGITVDQLINDLEYSDLLKEVLERFGNVTELFNELVKLAPQDFQTIMLKIYDGDGTSELPQEDTDIVRNFVDYVSSETDIPYEELLTDTEYANDLRDAAASFGKTSSFFKATSKFSDEGRRNNINNLYNGSNYKAYGMTMNEADQLKKELDSAAKANNTTTDKFLSESQYADKVREVIDSSESCEGVGSIYKNEQSSVVQNVAKNIYNTKLEETVYDSKTKKYYYVTPSERIEIPTESISNDGLTATVTIKKSKDNSIVSSAGETGVTLSNTQIESKS